MCVYACVDVYVHLCACVCRCVHVCVDVCMCGCVYICGCAHTCTCVCRCVFWGRMLAWMEWYINVMVHVYLQYMYSTATVL